MCMYICSDTGHFVPEISRQYDGLIFLTLQEDITMLSQNFGHQSSSDSAPHPRRMDTLYCVLFSQVFDIAVCYKQTLSQSHLDHSSNEFLELKSSVRYLIVSVLRVWLEG